MEKINEKYNEKSVEIKWKTSEYYRVKFEMSVKREFGKLRSDT